MKTAIFVLILCVVAWFVWPAVRRPTSVRGWGGMDQNIGASRRGERLSSSRGR